MAKTLKPSKTTDNVAKARKALPKARKLKNTNDLKKMQGGKGGQSVTCLSCVEALKMMICS